MPTELRIMSFNIRTQGATGDGPNHWDFRKGLVPRTIQNFQPDVLGMQEVRVPQGEYLQENLPEYTFMGRRRSPKDPTDEQCAILFKTDRFEKADEGHFWHSETPDVPGSTSWETRYPRMVSWVKLLDRNSDNQAFYHFNTHLDHHSASARLAGANLLRERAFRIANGSPIIITGDFNCDEASPPYKALLKLCPDTESRLQDSLRVVHPERQKDEGTFHGWQANRDGQRIDWLMTSLDINCLQANIVYDNYEGRYPTDHFPITAVIRLP